MGLHKPIRDLYKLHLMNSAILKAKTLTFLNAEEFAQLSVINFEILRNEASRKLAHFYGIKMFN